MSKQTTEKQTQTQGGKKTPPTIPGEKGEVEKKNPPRMDTDSEGSGGSPGTAVIEVPLGEIPETGYVSTHVELTNMTPTQKRGLRAVALGLDRDGCRLQSGRRVISGADAVRYMLEQAGASVPPA